MEKYNKSKSTEKRLNPGDKKSKWKDKARTRLRRRHAAIEPRLGMTLSAKNPLRTVTTG